MKLCPKCHKQFSDDANFCPVCAARLQPLEGDAGASDGLAARFVLSSKLGGGRTGAVLSATDKQNGNKAVAIKVIAPAVIALPGVAQRLERELKQLERVSSAGVTKVIASGKRTGAAGEETWVAMEMLEGAQTLAEAITARGPIGTAEAAQLIEVIGEALIEAAQVGVVHRDLAPKNVLFAGSDVKLINFSLPVPADKVAGVAEFVAPEQLEGKAVDQRSNLYSLGALYYYVLTGGPVVADANGTITPPSQIAGVPPPVEQLILRALDKSPTKRFLTVRQFVDEVGRVARGEGDVKATMPMGKILDKPNPAKAKAELVQTLIGVRGGSGPVSAPVMTPAAGAPIASAPTVGGVSALAPAVLAAAPVVASAPLPAAPIVPTPAVPVPAPNAANPVSSTIVGMSGGVMSTPSPATATAPAPSPDSVPAPAPAAVLASSPAERSPWAPEPAAPVAAPPPVTAAPAPAPSAPVMPAPAAPVIAKPIVAATKPEGVAAAGKKKPADAEDKKAQKGKFRETMWFKKGELDAQAAESAASDRAKGQEAAGDKADTLPIDERYKDDGSISRGDKEKYSLRTGATQMMAAVKDEPATSGARVSEDALIGEMKGGRNTILIVLAAAVVAIILVVVLFAR